MILAIDLGTTNWKAALIREDGQIPYLAHIATPVIEEDGAPCYESSRIREHIQRMLSQLPQDELPHVGLIAFTGMA